MLVLGPRNLEGKLFVEGTSPMSSCARNSGLSMEDSMTAMAMEVRNLGMNGRNSAGLRAAEIFPSVPSFHSAYSACM